MRDADAIVRELAARGPLLVDDHASSFLECRLCAPTRHWSKYEEAFKPSHPANHAPSCLWRLACRAVAEITGRAVLPSAMTSIISRYETAEALELSGHLWRGPARAMMLDAVMALAAAFPDDRFYQDRAGSARRLNDTADNDVA